MPASEPRPPLEGEPAYPWEGSHLRLSDWVVRAAERIAYMRPDLLGAWWYSFGMRELRQRMYRELAREPERKAAVRRLGELVERRLALLWIRDEEAAAAAEQPEASGLSRDNPGRAA